MKKYENPLTNNICQVLSPLIGDMMASGVIKAQATKLGITEESILPAHLPVLAEAIEKGLVIFLGSEVAQQVGEKIKAL
ncbi:MAG: hypothetical protein JXB34_01945 [Bacteroidales bacterium]|nr:hypothetical protein [Bacteroidales bacterium]